MDHGQTSYGERNDPYRARAGNREVFEFENASWVRPKDLSECRVAIVTTAGLRNDGVVDWASGDQSFALLPHDERNLFVAHVSQNFDRTGFAADVNVVYPVDRLEEFAASGTIGSVAPRHVSFMGAQGDHTMATLRLDTGPAAAKALRDDGVDVALLTPV